jgi:hypothetical protein
MVAYGASPAPAATCGQLTRAEIQPLMSAPITMVKVAKVLTGQQCEYLADGGKDIDVIVVKGGQSRQDFASEVSSIDSKVAVKGVGDKAYRAKGDFQIDAIKGNDFCSVSIGAGDTVPGVGALELAAGGTSAIPESDNAVVAEALGTICNRIFHSGSTTVSLAALRASGTTTATTAGGSSGSLKPPGTTQSTKTVATDPESVTFMKLTDPAVPKDPDNAANPGMRWVGLQFKVVVHGPDSVGGTGFVIGGDGVTYGFNSAELIGPFPGCTGTTGTPPEGKPWTICTGTMMPTGVAVAKVVFSGTGSNQSGPGVLYWSPS